VLPRNVSWKWAVGDTLGGTDFDNAFIINSGDNLLEYIDYRDASDSLYIQYIIKLPGGWGGGW